MKDPPTARFRDGKLLRLASNQIRVFEDELDARLEVFARIHGQKIAGTVWKKMDCHPKGWL